MATVENRPLMNAEQREVRRLDWVTRLCRVPARYAAATRHTWETSWKGRRSPWPSVLDDWTGEGDEAFLTLSGAPGTGKTHAAVSLLTDWALREGGTWPRLHRKRGARLQPADQQPGELPDRMAMISVPIAAAEIQEYYARKDFGDDYLIGGVPPDAFYARVCREYDLVILDDWAAQPDTSTWWSRIETWAYGRDARMQATIFTKNTDGTPQSTDRLARRINDGLVVPMPWKEKK